MFQFPTRLVPPEKWRKCFSFSLTALTIALTETPQKATNKYNIFARTYRFLGIPSSEARLMVWEDPQISILLKTEALLAAISSLLKSHKLF